MEEILKLENTIEGKLFGYKEHINGGEEHLTQEKLM